MDKRKAPIGFPGIARSLIAAVVGGIAFKLLHLPIPWLLGPMFAVLIGSNTFKGRFAWPGQFRDAGMIVVGYTIGLAMTASELKEMSYQLPLMLLMTLLLLLWCAGIAYPVSRLAEIDYKTSLLGSIPGGLTQVLVLAEETDGVNLTVVTVTQVIRLILIITCVPLLVMSPLFGQMHGGAAAGASLSAVAAGWNTGLLPNLLVYALVSVGCAILGNKIKFPTAFLLGPALGTAVLQLTGFPGPALPSFILNAAQLLIGVHVGLMLKPGRLTHKLRTISLAVGSGLLLMLGAWGLSVLLAKLQPISGATGLLSLAPGGMDQMGIIAHEIHADLSMVAGYQLFRTFFIFFAVPPLLKLMFRYHGKSIKRRETQ
ncbi:AbrB family transcriptional regulator [Paenibacillus ehimensis]|uniref:AbrB family transcriptional regulator n=1 Tax=Paenibacillus ehimensis TaxID=79264 RepID=A0ABT8VD45_9BACL|nr:AbrB family transcriptional regulator [Paenibacillus ehimensis]MDO3678868.1 AbrB family transcriptional regulator [Paenibacillus ehimensis]MEC0211040.1 AbrB family transcriptional regulator [Paenibacillus ehimensis]